MDGRLLAYRVGCEPLLGANISLSGPGCPVLEIEFRSIVAAGERLLVTLAKLSVLF